MYQKTRIILDWTIVFVEYALVLLIIPISNKLPIHLSADTVDTILNYIINISVGAVYISLLVFLLKKGKATVSSSYIWLVAFFIVTAYFLKKEEITAERFHFLGYGVLSLFLYRALRHNIGTKMLYVWSSVCIMLFAILDESCQLFGLGGRAFEFRDIGIDWLSSLIGQGIIALVVRPQLETIDIKIRGYVKAFEKAKAFQALKQPVSGAVNLDRLAEQVSLVFTKRTGHDRGHVHFMYEGKSEHLVLLCHNGKLENIIAKGRNCKKGEYLTWEHSEFCRLTPRDAFLKSLPKVCRIVIDQAPLQESWDSFLKFQNWLNASV